jgi:hypothetical protein
VEKITGKEHFKASNLGDDAESLVIGDLTNATVFSPKMNFGRWGGEVSFGLDLSGVPLITSPSLDFSAGIVTFGNANYKLYFKDDGVENVKFGLILNRKPPINQISFNLSNTDDLDFCYQPWMANVNPDGSSWEGNCFAPPSVGGSYAVYHKTKRNHIIGQTNYKIGKVGHFYCPKFTDALGNFVWGLLEITGNVFKITIPQAFLNSATYPVTENGTFGYTTTPVNSNYWNVNQTTYLQLDAVSPAGSNTLTNLSVCVTTYEVTLTYKFGFYSESSSTPNTRLAVDASNWNPGVVSKTWVINPVAWSYALAASTQYWGAGSSTTDIAGDDRFVWWYDNSGSKAERYESAVLPATASSGADLTSKHNGCYATYTVAVSDLSVFQSECVGAIENLS